MHGSAWSLYNHYNFNYQFKIFDFKEDIFYFVASQTKLKYVYNSSGFNTTFVQKLDNRRVK